MTFGYLYAAWQGVLIAPPPVLYQRSPIPKYPCIINDLRAVLHVLHHVHNPVDNLCITAGYNPHYIACYPMRLYATILHL